MRRYLRKQNNVIDGAKELLKKQMTQERKERNRLVKLARGNAVDNDTRNATQKSTVLDRFKRKLI